MNKSLRYKFIVVILSIFLYSTNCNAQGRWYNLDGGLGCNSSYCQYWQWAYAMCPDTVNNVLYVGGEFNLAGNNTVDGLAKWNGNSWEALPDEGLGKVDALIMYKGSLYVGQSNVNGVYKYDGNTWSELPALNGAVTCFCIYNDTLYAGGGFTKSNGKFLNGVAKWNGTSWSPLVNGIYGSCCPGLLAMSVYQGKLIAAGYFSNAGAISTLNIAAWNDSAWSQLGNGLNWVSDPTPVFALEVFKEKLYIGYLDSVNNYFTHGIASWDGTIWDSLPQRANMGVNALKSFDGYLFTGGDIGNFGFGIQKFDGNSFSSVDSGTNELVYSLAAFDGSLYVGGEFDTVGKTLPAKGIARWTTDTGIDQVKENNRQVTVYPNPALNELTITSNQLPITEVQIINVLGQILLETNFKNGFQKQVIDVSTLSAGIYFYRLTNVNSQVVTGKFVKE